jgi:hypothetical protein
MPSRRTVSVCPSPAASRHAVASSRLEGRQPLVPIVASPTAPTHDRIVLHKYYQLNSTSYSTEHHYIHSRSTCIYDVNKQRCHFVPSLCDKCTYLGQ